MASAEEKQPIPDRISKSKSWFMYPFTYRDRRLKKGREHTLASDFPPLLQSKLSNIHPFCCMFTFMEIWGFQNGLTPLLTPNG